jgi:hypothetical protein
LDSPLADDKEDASDLRAAISRANRKRSTPKPYNRPDNQYVASTGDREVLNSIQGGFFVALANSAERDITVKPVGPNHRKMFLL